MSFVEAVERARQLLQKSRRLSLRALKREFALDDDALAELADELVEVQRVAVREGGRSSARCSVASSRTTSS